MAFGVWGLRSRVYGRRVSLVSLSRTFGRLRALFEIFERGSRLGSAPWLGVWDLASRVLLVN